MNGHTKKRNFLLLGAALLTALLCFTLTACMRVPRVITSANEIDIPYDTSRYIQFEIEMESGAKMTGELEPLRAPITVRNFVTLCDDGYYDGTAFDYIINNKLVMCSGKNEENPPYTIYGEFSDNNWKNGIQHYKWTLSMSHKENDNNSAYSKFFILLENRASYNGKYAGFGRITSGQANLEQISKVDLAGTVPIEPQTIKSIRILGNVD